MEMVGSLFSKLFSLLPASPVQAFFSGKGSGLAEILGWVNWFIPFDLCFKLTEAWAACVAAWYLFSAVGGSVLRRLFDRLLG